MHEIIEEVLNEDPVNEPALVQDETGDKHSDIAILGQEVDSIKKQLDTTQSQLDKAKVEADHISKAASGISVIQWSADSKQDAQELLHDLFEHQLIADAQILDSRYNRMFLKFNRQQLDSQTLVRMLTADARVQELVSYIKNHNPNHLNKDMATDIMVNQLTSGSQDYIDWVKKQTELKEQ